MPSSAFSNDLGPALAQARHALDHELACSRAARRPRSRARAAAPSGTGSMPSPRVNWMQPPLRRRAASTPEGLPWKTRSQAVAAAQHALALASAARRRSQLEHGARQRRRRSPPSAEAAAGGQLEREPDARAGGAPSAASSASRARPMLAVVAGMRRGDRRCTMLAAAAGVDLDLDAAFDADGERRHAVHHRVLAEQDHLAARARAVVIDVPRRQRQRRAVSSSRPWSVMRRLPSAPGLGDQLVDARARRLAAPRSLRAPRAPAAPRRRSRAACRARASSAPVLAPARALQARACTSSVRLPAARSPPSGLPVCFGIAERAEQVVAQLKGDADRQRKALERAEQSRPRRRRAARRVASGPRTV